MPTPIWEPSFNPSKVDYCYNNIIKLQVKDLVEICNKDVKVNKKKGNQFGFVGAVCLKIE